VILAANLSLDYQSVLTCAEIEFIQHEKYNNETQVTIQDALMSVRDRYPDCLNPIAGPKNTYVVVNARLTEENRYPEETIALFNILFGISGILGLTVNVLAVETYIRYSGDEDQRLKVLSSTWISAAVVAKLAG
jgi:hypothetical protein